MDNGVEQANANEGADPLTTFVNRTPAKPLLRMRPMSLPPVRSASTIPTRRRSCPNSDPAVTKLLKGPGEPKPQAEGDEWLTAWLIAARKTARLRHALGLES